MVKKTKETKKEYISRFVRVMGERNWRKFIRSPYYDWIVLILTCSLVLFSMIYGPFIPRLVGWAFGFDVD
jgi:hypothetical protein